METHEHNITQKSVFEIDGTTKRIVKPETMPSLVQGSHNSERISFTMHKEINGHDMSRSSVSIHYADINTDTGESSEGVYEVDDLASDGENITFSWLISGEATRYWGGLCFSVRFACIEDGKTVYQFNTVDFAAIPVYPSRDNMAGIVERYPDIMAQLFGEIASMAVSLEMISDSTDMSITELTSLSQRLNEAEKLVKDNRIAYDDGKVIIGYADTSRVALYVETTEPFQPYTTYECHVKEFMGDSGEQLADEYTFTFKTDADGCSDYGVEVGDCHFNYSTHSYKTGEITVYKVSKKLLDESLIPDTIARTSDLHDPLVSETEETILEGIEFKAYDEKNINTFIAASFNKGLGAIKESEDEVIIKMTVNGETEQIRTTLPPTHNEDEVFDENEVFIGVAGCDYSFTAFGYAWGYNLIGKDGYVTGISLATVPAESTNSPESFTGGTLEISKVVINPIEEKYIPDTIARTITTTIKDGILIVR